MSYNYDHDCPFEAFITNLRKYVSVQNPVS